MSERLLAPILASMRLLALIIIMALAVAPACSESAAHSGSHAASSHPPAEVPQPTLKVKASPFLVHLSWTLPAGADVDGFVVTRDGDEIALLTGTATRYDDNDVSPPGYHVYSVEATSGHQRSQAAMADARLSVPQLAAARLDGYFNIRLTVTSSSGYSGDLPKGAGWHFRPRCRHGACDVIWSDNASHTMHARGSRHGARYIISYSGYHFTSCNGAHATSVLHITLRVTKARVSGGEWLASRVQGTMTQSEAEQLGCVASQSTSKVLGHAITT
jgi:hypothetical protein